MASDTLAERLLALRRKIERAKSDKDQAEGALKTLKQRLADEFDLKDTESAQGHLEELRVKGTKLEMKLEELLSNMEAAYGA